MQAVGLFRAARISVRSVPVTISYSRAFASKSNGSASRTASSAPAPKKKSADASVKPDAQAQATASNAESSASSSKSIADDVDVSSSSQFRTPSLDTPTTLSLDFAPSESSSDASSSSSNPSDRTGARSSADSLSSIERRRRYFTRAIGVLFGIGVLVQGVYAGREWDEEELRQRKLTKETAPSTSFGRAKSRLGDVFDIFSKPQWTELLPPPLPAPHQKPYTLLLSIDDLLVHSTWDRQNGWRTAKRPGVDYFLAYLSQFYEIVIFTSQYSYTAIPVVEKLDPYQFYISYKLFRESTRMADGDLVKDLSYLNRDLSKVVLLDTDPKHIKLQPENGVIISKWKGEPGDKGLVSMIPFLESIAIYKPADVRPILKAYAGKDVAVEYAKKEAELKKQFLDEWRAGRAKEEGGGFTLSGLFGGASPMPQTKEKEPLTYLERKRLEAQHFFREEQKYIEDNKANFDKLLDEERKALEKQMSGNVGDVVLNLMGVVAPPNQQQQQQGQQPTGTTESTIPATTTTAAGILGVSGGQPQSSGEKKPSSSSSPFSVFGVGRS